MDASESDIFIQKHAADFIADFNRSLNPFLRKPNGQLRQRVRSRETARLISKVSPLGSIRTPFSQILLTDCGVS